MLEKFVGERSFGKFMKPDEEPDDPRLDGICNKLLLSIPPYSESSRLKDEVSVRDVGADDGACCCCCDFCG